MGIFDFFKKNKNIENDNGLNETYYNNGKGELKEKFTKKNGNIEGLYKNFFKNGKIKETISYIRNKFDGRFKMYYSTGEVRVEGNCSNGKKNGDFILYKYRRSHEENGDFNNISKYYIEKVTGRYENNKKEGVWKRTKEGYIDGNEEGEWKKNQNELTIHDITFENFKKKYITIYCDKGVPEIKYDFNNTKGEYFSDGEWIEDTGEGKYTGDGHLTPSIDFEKNYEFWLDFFDDLDTNWFRWDEDTSIEFRRRSSSSKEFDGIFKLYHLNGQLKSEKKWKGIKLLHSKYWDEDGNKIKFNE